MDTKVELAKILSSVIRRIYFGTKKDGSPDKRVKHSYMLEKLPEGMNVHWEEPNDNNY